MQTEARVGVMMEGGGGQRGLSSGHGSVSIDKSSQQQQNQSQIGTVSQFLAGGVAGALSKTCTAPLARLTILFQVQGMHSDAATLRKASIWREASRIVSEEGFRAFWKGNLVMIAHRLPFSSVNFYAYEHFKKSLHVIPVIQSHRGSMSTELGVHFVAGGLAGITAASATYPLDLVRTRLAAQTNVIYYRGIGNSLRTICRDEGVLGLYKGLGATLLGVGPSLAIGFSVYETLRSFWQSRRPHDSTALVSLACGSLSGIASSTGSLSKRLVLRLFWSTTPLTISLSEFFHQLICSHQTVDHAMEWTPLLLPLCFELLVSLRSLGEQAYGMLIDSLFLATFPLDLVKRRKQLEGAGGRARVYTTGLFGTFKHIIRTEGFHGLYRGILPEYYKVVPGVGICFMTYETLKMLLAE